MANKSSPHGGFISEGTVSHGTLRTQDLLRSFADEYQRVLPFNGYSIAYDARETADIVDRPTAYQPQGFACLAYEVLFNLIDALDEIARREGLIFGAHEGDGSDFGYWSIESED